MIHCVPPVCNLQWKRWLPLVLFLVASLPFLLRGHHQDDGMHGRGTGDTWEVRTSQ